MFKVIINYSESTKKEMVFNNIKDTIDIIEKYYKYVSIDFYDFELSDNVIMVINNDLDFSELCDMYH